MAGGGSSRQTAGVGPAVSATIADAVERSAAPVAVGLAVERITHARPDAADRIAGNEALLDAVVAVCGASRSMASLLATDPLALDALADLDHRAPPDTSSTLALRAWKERESLRIAARDLLAVDSLEATVAAVSACARDVLAGAHGLALGSVPRADSVQFAIIAMGKFGGNELNYASDVDVMFAAEGDAALATRIARVVVDSTRPSFRVDVNLRPQGRDGPLVLSLGAYEAYWDRWAQPWEFQALLKARAAGGHHALGAAFDAAAARHLWSRPFSADDLRSLRRLKARVEADLARKGLTDREVKRGRGGLRDIEFAVQLLQLVHGRLDPALRSPTTIDALATLATAGYVDPDDAAALADAYRFLRAVEHRLQLMDGQQVYAMPADEASRTRIARTLGFRDRPDGSALEQLDVTLGQHQATVRSIHERLYFRPLLEAFSSADTDAELLARPGALEARLSAFGFSDTLRTKAAVRDLTRGFTRTSRLMQQMLPLLFAWLAESPDPDLGLLNLRNLVGDGDALRSTTLAKTFRDSPEAARRLCRLVGTSRLASDLVKRNLDVVGRLPSVERLATDERAVLVDKARAALAWRTGLHDRTTALRRWKDRNLLGVVARDLLGEATVARVGADISALAEAVLEVGLESLDPQVPFTVIALGRFGGAELSYASDLDVVFVYEGGDAGAAAAEEGLRLASGLRRLVGGATPSVRMWELDVDLRPEGKNGPLARSLDGYRAYFARWALVWERQAMLRARPVAGDAALGARFGALLEDFVWAPGTSIDDEREIRRIKARIERERIPAGEDPQFHLKLGPGSLSDVEWTAQLLQLRHRIRATGTWAAISALVADGALDAHDGAVLHEAYRFCERTRNRLFLVRSTPGDALPTQPDHLAWLARSLDTTPTGLRDEYRRVTRRARAVVERVFYARTE